MSKSSNFSYAIEAIKLSIRPHKGLIAAAIAISVLYGLASIGGLAAFVPIVSIIGGDDFLKLSEIPYVGSFLATNFTSRTGAFYAALAVIVGLSIARGVLQLGLQLMEAYVKNAVDSHWQELVVSRWLGAPFSEHGRARAGRIMHLCANEIGQVGYSARAFIVVLTSCIQVAILMTFLALVSLPALIGTCITVVMVVMPLVFITRQSLGRSAADAAKGGIYTEKIHNAVKRIQLIDIFGTAEHERRSLGSFFKDYLQARLRLQTVRSLGPLVSQVTISALLAVLLIYFFNLGASSSTLATVIFFIGGVALVHPHIDRINENILMLARAGVAYEAIRDILTLPSNARLSLGKISASQEKIPVSVKVHGLTFSYPGAPATDQLFKNVDLTFESGRLYMLFGATGAGKTTFLRLLQGSLVPDQGDIRYGGRHLDDLDHETLKHTVLTMEQDNHVFSGTVRENIEYGQWGLADEFIQSAIVRAAAADFVNALPHGIDTDIGNDGNLLSGGQRQRIALARCFAASPSVLLLDEPTSALDRETEHQVMESLFGYCESGRVVVMSTHKVELAPLADVVIWFEKGSLKAGSFEEFQRNLVSLVPHRAMRRFLDTMQA